MSNNIWVINEYAGSPYHGMEFRHYYLGKEFVKLGYNVTIITASFSHLFKNLPIVQDDYTIESIDGINYLWIKVNKYKNAHDKKRVFKWFIFTYRLFSLPSKKLPKPDVIVVSPMSTFCVYPAYRLAKKNKARLIFEVKDIWPLSLIEIGKYSPRHPFIIFMRFFEHFALKKSDYIVSNLPGYDQHLNDSGFDRDFHYIPNGIDLDELADIKPMDQSIVKQIPNDKFIIGYAGTVGLANALEYLIDAAYLLKDYKEIFFIVVGDGLEKNALLEKANGLKNIKFLDFIPKNQVQSLLKLFNICFIGGKNEKLYNYGISPNKIFDYMYSAKPIILSICTKKDIVSSANCGITVAAEDSHAIAEAILKIYNMPEQERKILGQNGKKYVLKHHTYTQLAKQYKEFIDLK